MLRLAGASYRYAGAAQDSLHGVSLEVPDGTITGLLGPTESGLTTLCMVLAGLAPRVIRGQLRGSLLIDGVDVAAWPMYRLCESVVLATGQPAGQLSMVASTVYEEIAFGPANLGLLRREVMERTEDSIEQLALVDLASRDPRRLSGGQQQLVALAALLAMRPRHLVLDEPLAHLDARTSELLTRALAAAAAQGTAVLIATTQSEVIARICGSVVMMAGGRIVRQGSASEVLADPATWALGVAEPAEQRLARLLAEAAAGAAS